MRFAVRLAVVCMAVLIPVGCVASSDSARVPLPSIDGKSVKLRVAHAINPRLSSLSEFELKTVLVEARKTVREHFGLELIFTEPETVSISELFSRIPAKALATRKSEIYDFKNGTGDRERLVNGMAHTLRNDRINLRNSIAYAKPNLLAPVEEHRYSPFAEALIDTHLKRLGHWSSLKAADGRPVIDRNDFNEWIVWDLLGYSGMPYDVIVTNQLVASAEYDDAAVHASLRGGVSNGGTSASEAGRYKAYSFMSTFPFTEFQSIPEGMGGISNREQAVRLAGQYLAHEIGHLLLHLRHPWDNAACVMRPEPLFDFIAWANALDASKCKLGSSPAMKPGAAKLFFRPY